MNEGSGCHITSRHGRRGRSNHSIDKMSINSGLSSHDGSQSSGDHFDEGRSICTNYDQPRSITTKSMSPQEALQFYDTPKSIKQALNTQEINMANQHRTDEKPNSRDTAQPNAFSGPYGNYD